MAKSTRRARLANEKTAARAGASSIDALTRGSGDPTLLRHIDSLAQSPRKFIEECLYVQRMGGGGMDPFRLNESQSVVMGAVEGMLRDEGMARVIVLKARRGGITTLSEALGYWATSTHSQINGMVVAHDNDTAKEIHRIAKFFYQYDVRHRLGCAPAIEQSNERALRFANPDKRYRHLDPGLESSMLVETAEGANVGRGLTLQFLHASEVGFYRNPTLMGGLEIALSKTPGSIGIFESTANGMGNLFHDQWERAIAGKSGWTPVFLPWMLRRECQMELTGLERQEWDWTSREERDYSEKHGLSLEQCKWRRRELNSASCLAPGRSREEMFCQEFPATADEAFLSSGRNFFLLPALKRLKDRDVRPPVWEGEITSDKPLHGRAPGDRSPIKPTVSAERYGPFQQWEAPRAGYDYCVSADVAEGLKHGDDSVALVMCRNTMRVVARWRGRRIDPDEFGQVCALIGWYYNTALVGIEINGPGIAANLAVRRLRYPRIWKDRNIETISENDRDRVGWKTTDGSRITMLQELEAELREGTIALYSAQFYAEAEHFVWASSDNGQKARPQAAAGKHDDEVMAAAILLQLHKRGGALPRTPKQKEVDLYIAPTVQAVRGKPRRVKDAWW